MRIQKFRLVQALTMLLTISAASALLSAQASDPASRGKASISPGGKAISINYGRPELKGRDVMKMAPAGTVWRMGMNEATEIETAATMKFPNLTIKPGKYTIWAKKVSESEWLLIFNKKTGQWGTEYDAKSDIGSTPLTLGQSASPVEVMVIDLSSKDKEGTFKLSWGPNTLTTKFTAE